MKPKLDFKNELITEIVRSKPMLYKVELLQGKNVTELKSILDDICTGRIHYEILCD